MAKAKYKRNSRGEFETKIWDGTYNPDGSKHRKRLVSKKSSADLERQVSQLKNGVENGQYVQKTAILFLDYAREWLAARKGVREKNTQAMYRNVIEHHLSFLEGVRLADIRNSHFHLAINNALDRPRTCQQIYITFRQILKMAVADNYIGAGMCAMICQDISLPKLVRKEKRPLTKAEREAIGKADFTDRERAFVYIIYSCRLRRGEALSAFDFRFRKEQATVSITKSLIFDGNAPEIKDMPKTENGFRTLPIPDSTAVFLQGYIAGLSGSFLFTCRDGGLVTHSSYVKMWASIRRKMNHAAGGTDAFPAITGLTAHTFRHNYCTNLCYKVPEISIKKIARLMGDSERMVLDVYNHIMEEREDPAAVINSILPSDLADTVRTLGAKNTSADTVRTSKTPYSRPLPLTRKNSRKPLFYWGSRYSRFMRHRGFEPYECPKNTERKASAAHHPMSVIKSVIKSLPAFTL